MLISCYTFVFILYHIAYKHKFFLLLICVYRTIFVFFAHSICLYCTILKCTRARACVFTDKHFFASSQCTKQILSIHIFIQLFFQYIPAIHLCLLSITADLARNPRHYWHKRDKRKNLLPLYIYFLSTSTMCPPAPRSSFLSATLF